MTVTQSQVRRRLIPVYTTRGDVGAFLVYPYLFNRQGEWIGWVAQDRKVYSVYGHFVGRMSSEPRILRKPSRAFDQPKNQPPARPGKITVPATVPLAPMMSDLPMGEIDVLDDAPELLPTTDAGELREDMD